MPSLADTPAPEDLHSPNAVAPHAATSNTPPPHTTTPGAPTPGSAPSLTTGQIWKRFGEASLLTTVVCLVVAYVLLKTTGVPPTYPPLLPMQVVSGTVGGALLVTLGYWLLSAAIPNSKTRNAIFLIAGVLLLVASYYLPYRLSYTTSPRFAGVTIAAQFGQGLLHTIVVGLSMFCFLRR